MSELAFDKEGNPFRFSRRTKKLRPRRWKNAGQRGTCAAVLDADGEQVLVDADAEYIEFRTAVGNVPGFYRLDQCDEDGAPIEDAPPAYVSIESTRNATPTGDVDPRDAIIRDLAQINADMVRTIAERFGNVMQATADVLRAADGAGLSRRQPPPLPSAPAPDDDEEDDEGDEDHGIPPSERVWAFVEPMLPAIGAWITEMATKRFASRTPAAAPSPAPAPAPAAAPSSAPAPGGVAAAPNAPEPVGAPEPSTASTPGAAAAASTPSATTAPAEPSTATAPPSATVGAEASSAPPPVSTPVAAASSSAPPAATTSEGSALDGAAPSTTGVADPMPAGVAQADAPRNAPPGIEPTLQQWAHLFAIRARLSPREAAITETVAVRMPLEMRAQWLAELSMLSVDEAVEAVRSMIPKAPPKPPAARNGAKDRGKESES